MAIMTRFIGALTTALLVSSAAVAQDPESEQEWDVTANRGETRQIEFTTSEGTWMSVDLAPDGAWIVFDLLGHVYRLPATGGGAENLTASSGVAVNYHPRYSPDGRFIAFVSDRNAQTNLWIMEADGSDPRPVFEDEMVRVVEPVWTPDGEYIVVRRQKLASLGQPGESGIWMYHRDGGQGIELVDSDDQPRAAWPSVSRDGKYLYFQVYTGPGGLTRRDVLRGHWQIRRLELRSGAAVAVTAGEASEQIRSSSGGGYAAEVSPDGRQLAFARRIPDGTISYKGHRFGPRTALWLRDLESGAERVIMDPITVDNAEGIKTLRILPGYDWSDDGRSILISQGGKIRRLDVQTGDVTTIPFEASVQRTASQQARANFRIDDEPFRARFLRWFSATPDGRRLVFQAVGKVWTMDLPGGAPRPLTPESFEPFEYSPAASPDGRWSAFTTWDAEDGGHLWKARASGGRPEQLTRTAGEYVHPVWSPDGRSIVMTRGNGAKARHRGSTFNSYWQLVRVPADGGDVQPIVTVAPPGSGSPFSARSQIVRASFGPDGRIYYPEPVRRERSGQGGSRTVTALASVRADGSDRREHFTFEFADEVVVSPDGAWVAFQEADNVYVTPFPRAGTGGDAPMIDNSEKKAVLPVRRLTTEGGLFPRWRSERVLDFGSGPFFYSYDVVDESADTVEIELRIPRPIPDVSIALTGARIITLKEREVIDGGTVLIERSRIACVGDCDASSADTTIDLLGATIIPGLIDMHAHHYREHRGLIPKQNFESAVYFAYGVTTNLDNSMWSQSVFAAAELIRAGRVIGPRTYSTGDPIYRGEGSRRNEVTSREVAGQEVNKLASWGAVAIKQYLQARRQQRQWVVDAARERGLMVTSEGSDLPYNIGMILDGHTAWEHPMSYTPLYGDAARFFGMAGAVYSPTFMVGGSGPWNEGYFFAERDVWKDAKQRRWMPWRQTIPHMRRRTLRPDTDYSYPFIAQGLSEVIEFGGWGAIGSHGQAHGIASHWEVWMAASALGAMGALELATVHGARFLGAEADLGSIEVGKLADLVVLNANPLDDIRNTLDIRYVMQGGVLYDDDTLDEIWPEQTPYGPYWWVNEDALRMDDRPVDFFEQER